MRFLERWTLDRPLFFGILMLSAFGIAMIYSAGQVSVPNVVTADAWVRQVQWLIIALVVFSAVSRIPVRWIVWAALPSYVISVVLLALTLVIGEGRGTAAGVKSWINIGGFGFQPAEIAKIATILALAQLLSTRETGLTSLRELVKPGAVVGLPLGLVMLQPDLGTALAFVGILFANAVLGCGTRLASHACRQPGDRPLPRVQHRGMVDIHLGGDRVHDPLPALSALPVRVGRASPG